MILTFQGCFWRQRSSNDMGPLTLSSRGGKVKIENVRLRNMEVKFHRCILGPTYSNIIVTLRLSTMLRHSYLKAPLAICIVRTAVVRDRFSDLLK